MTRLTDALSLPLGGKSLILFKSMIMEKEREEMLTVCARELQVLDKRFRDGDTVTAVLALLERMRETKSKL
jgi:hypothetical protein